MDQHRQSSSATRLGEALTAARPMGRIEAMFGSKEFFRLWIAQVISATGDWLGLIAIISLADRLSDGSEGTAIALVLAARIAPGFFLATAAGVLVDRLDRKRVMLVCDISRALVLFSLPFVDSLVGLIVASFALEICTMMWSPAKEAVVPNIVPKEKLTTANSLNVAAAYGMFPVAAGIAALLAKLAESFSDEGWVNTFRLNQEGLAFYVDGLSFLATALIVWTIAFPRRSREERKSQGKTNWELGGAVRELREGWQFIAVNPIVRAVNVGLAVGVIGGGMLVPLGALFVNDVISGDEADFDLILFALGLGMALGVITASALQNRINRSKVFPLALLMAGSALLVSGSSSLLGIVVPVIGIAGFAAGPIYVLGFTMLHEHVEDELRGRIFAALLVLVRFCLLLALAIAPLLAEAFDVLSDRWWDSSWDFFGVTIAVPGVRLTMWISAITVLAAGVLATWSLRATNGKSAGSESIEESTEDDR
ncbi:MAG: MFS transporter [Acidimicrobiaceae bacterium]|nr:MFS transporter [Acidimicrobiaceae bacterium]MYA75920.1 MFS transporter [Acidimicrobiaceae bacterium]MYG56553.1 MFS transporter [Acidimicrobiaceae bacterium]MYJ97536.1 MFS transporter [Acidimicrobiaceae bacterium]